MQNYEIDILEKSLESCKQEYSDRKELFFNLESKAQKRLHLDSSLQEKVGRK